VRRLRPGLAFHFRRLKADSVTTSVTVRLSPERRLGLVRDSNGWAEAVETIPWSITRLRVTGVIETSLYDALDKAVADSFLPPGAPARVPPGAASVPPGLESLRRPLPSHPAPVAGPRRRRLLRAVWHPRARHRGRHRDTGGP